MVSQNDRIAVFGEMFFPDTKPNRWYPYLQAAAKTDPTALFPNRQKEIFQKFLEDMNKQAESRPLFIDLKMEQIHAEPHLHKVIYNKENNHSFVILRRLNYLKQILSEQIMYARFKQGDQVVHRGNVPDAIMVKLDAKQTLSMLRWRTDLAQKFRTSIVASGCPYIDLFYEEMLEDGGVAAAKRVQDFMGVPHVSGQPVFVKQNPQPLSKLIENYDEIEGAVRSSEFAYCLYLPS